MNERQPTEAWAREMLAFLTPDVDRKAWLRIGMALKVGLDGTGFDVWDEWSRGGATYDGDDCRRAWDSFTPHGGVTWGTLVHHAKAAGWKPPNAEVTRWRICDPDGKAVAVHCRMDRPDGDKRLWWETPDGGKGLAGRKAIDLPLYRIEAVKPDTPIVVCEGEKAADALADVAGISAVGTVTGASSTPSADVLATLAERDVYLWPDNDDPGRKHMRRVADRLPDAANVRLIEWGAAPPKGDAADWATSGKTPPLADLLAASKPPEAKPKRKPGRPRKPGPSGPSTSPTPDDPRPVIVRRAGERMEWTKAAVRALVAAGEADDRRSLYASTRVTQGNGAPCGDVVALGRAPAPDQDAAHLRIPADTLVIRDAPLKIVCARLDKAARWITAGRKGDLRPDDCRPDDADHVLARYATDLVDDPPGPSLRVLRGVVDAPTLRADGTLLDTPGYDAATGLYADFKLADWPGLPTAPTRDDAREALHVLYDLVAETPFATPVHRAVWATLVLTLVGRPYAAGNVPLFAFSANSKGSGKGTAVDLAALIASGRTAPKWSPVAGRPVDQETEDRKRIMAIALSGARCVCIDNVPPGQPVGSAAMDAAITAGTDERKGRVADRVLGETAITEATWSCVLAATGNNLTLKGDAARRALLCRLHVDAEPDTKVYHHHPKVADYCLEQRPRMLAAALTVLAAHRDAVARGDTEPLRRIPSFGSWSDRIRSAVAWADAAGADPWRANDEVKASAVPEQQETAVFLAAWHDTFGGREATVAEVARRCDPEAVDYAGDLAEAVADLNLAPPRGKQAVNARSLGMWLRGRKDRPGPHVLREGDKPRSWFIEETEAANATPEPEPAPATDADQPTGWPPWTADEVIRGVSRVVWADLHDGAECPPDRIQTAASVAARLFAITAKRPVPDECAAALPEGRWDVRARGRDAVVLMGEVALPRVSPDFVPPPGLVQMSVQNAHAAWMDRLRPPRYTPPTEAEVREVLKATAPIDTAEEPIYQASAPVREALGLLDAARKEKRGRKAIEEAEAAVEAAREAVKPAVAAAREAADKAIPAKWRAGQAKAMRHVLATRAEWLADPAKVAAGTVPHPLYDVVAWCLRDEPNAEPPPGNADKFCRDCGRALGGTYAEQTRSQCDECWQRWVKGE